MTSETQPPVGSLLASIFNEDTFHPTEPRTIEETGLTATSIESMICKYVMLVGSASGRQIAENVCLPFGILEDLFRSLRARQIIVHSASAQLNDYYYTLTDQGRERTKSMMDSCGYVGPAPVPLVDYILSVEAQTIRAESPRRQQLEDAFTDISVDTELFDQLGPAINSGAGLFLYGAPGNGKTTLASKITACFGQDIWIPKTLIDDGQLIKLYDAAYHQPHVEQDDSLLKTADFDRRWIKVRRPTVVVGGELTLEALEIRHDPICNVSEAPLQLKSNCGCLLIDDFGRQRIEPTELLNRWIIPLECGHDFLTLATGKKVQVPFDQLIIFSTNLDPSDLTDEAFLRRIPYKIEVGDPTVEEFRDLFEVIAVKYQIDFDRETIDHLIETHYRPTNRALRRCHPRDLMSQIRNYCAYSDLPTEMRKDYFDRVVKSYFTVVAGKDSDPQPAVHNHVTQVCDIPDPPPEDAVQTIAEPALPAPVAAGDSSTPNDVTVPTGQ